MLSDITLGQYIPCESVIHNLDPRVKIVFSIVYMVTIFLANSVYAYIFLVIFTLGIIISSKIKLIKIVKGMKPVIFIVVFTALVNLFLLGGDEVLFSYGFLKITSNGIEMAVLMSLRLILLVVGTSLLTYTTPPILLTDGIEKLLNPLKKIKFPSHELAMMMTIALRFIPTLLEETDKIIKAQRARGADFESGNIIKRIKSLVPILIPLFINSFRRADELALAMECRCYRGGDGRTRLKQLHIGKRDVIAVAVIACFVLITLLLNII